MQGLGRVEGGNLAEEGGAHLGGELLLAPNILAYVVAADAVPAEPPSSSRPVGQLVKGRRVILLTALELVEGRQINLIAMRAIISLLGVGFDAGASASQ